MDARPGLSVCQSVVINHQSVGHLTRPGAHAVDTERGGGGGPVFADVFVIGLLASAEEETFFVTHDCFLPLPLSLLGPFELPLLVVPAVLLPLQPLVLVLFVAVIPAEQKIHMTSPSELVLYIHPSCCLPRKHRQQSPRTWACCLLQRKR